MHLAVIERDGNCRTRLQDREMSRPAENDIAAFRQIDLCLARSERKIAAAGQQGRGASVLGLKADRSVHGNVISGKPSNHLLAPGRTRYRGLRRLTLRLKDQQGYEAEHDPEDGPLAISACGFGMELVCAHIAHIGVSVAYTIAHDRIGQVAARARRATRRRLRFAAQTAFPSSARSDPDTFRHRIRVCPHGWSDLTIRSSWLAAH